MPSARAERHVLNHLPIAANKRVSRYTAGGRLPKIRMSIQWKVARKQAIDPRTAEFPRGQADSMHDDQVGEHGTDIEVRRQHLPDTNNQAGGGVDLHLVNAFTTAELKARTAG